MNKSIKLKFIAGFMKIFFAALFLLFLLIGNVFERSNENIIIEQMKSLKESSVVYIWRYMFTKNITPDQDLLYVHGKEIMKELSSKNNYTVAIYNKFGMLLFCSDEIERENSLRQDMYGTNTTLFHDENLEIVRRNDLPLGILLLSIYKGSNENGKKVICLSYPLILNKVNVGTIKFIKDYTILNENNYKLFIIITLSICGMFIAICLFSVLLVNKITTPLLKLSKISKEIASGNYRSKLVIYSDDEIEELALNFADMQSKIKEQIETIQKDKEALLRLEKHRKVFFDNVTHELKTPLTTISGYAQIIGENGFDDKEFLQRAAARIKSESERLHQMVIDMLEISKINTEQYYKANQPFNLSELISVVSEDMKLQGQQRGMTISKDITKSMYVHGNSDQMRQVLINLLDNAIKYGEINSTVEIAAYIKGAMCEVLIRNTGSDIPADKVERVFEPFFRLNHAQTAERGSAGLGLYIAKSIIEKHGGSISIKSESDFTEVSFKIPCIGNTLATSV